MLINQAIHALDLMIYLAGKPKSVDAIMHNFSLKDTALSLPVFQKRFSAKRLQTPNDHTIWAKKACTILPTAIQ